jgi:hypothetical protein
LLLTKIQAKNSLFVPTVAREVTSGEENWLIDAVDAQKWERNQWAVQEEGGGSWVVQIIAHTAISASPPSDRC